MYIKKLINIFYKEEKLKFKFILVLILISNLLETLSIGLVYPLIKVFISNDIYEIHPLVTELLIILNYPSKENFLIIILLIFIIIFIIKNLFIFFSLTYKNKFLIKIQTRISLVLYKFYLNKDYSFFFTQNVSDLIKNCTFECNRVYICLNSFINLIVELLLFIFVFTLLSFINFKVSLIIFLFILIFSLVYFLFVKKRLKIWATLAANNFVVINDNIMTTFNNIRAIKMLKNHLFFYNDLLKGFKNYNKVAYKMRVANQSPRLWLEIISIIIFGLYIFRQPQNLFSIEFIAIFGTIFFAFLRLLPSAYKILVQLQEFSFSKTSLDIVLPILKKQIIKKTDIGNGDLENKKKSLILKSVEFKNVSYSYGDQKFKIDNINFALKLNDNLLISGPSGSGKSTIVDIIAGLIYPKSGNILINDKVYLNKDEIAQVMKDNIGYVSQNISFINSTVSNNITLGFDNIDQKLLTKVAKITELNKLNLNLDIEKILNTEVSELGKNLSGGQKQRIGIARALYLNPKLLIFDEATSGLDKNSENSILKNIISQFNNLIFIIISHHKIDNIKFSKYLNLSHENIKSHN